jgi:hypothetical protein
MVACSTVLGVQKSDHTTGMLQQANWLRRVRVVGHAADELDGAHRAGMATIAVNYGLMPGGLRPVLGIRDVQP